MSKKIIAFFLFIIIPFGISGCFIPTDRELATKLENALREELNPQSVKVSLRRKGLLSTTVLSLNVEVSGFSTHSMPFISSGSSPLSLSQPSGGLSFTSLSSGKTRKIRIKDSHIRFENFNYNNYPIESMNLELREVKVPVNGSRIKIESAESATAKVSFTEAGLTKVLKMRELPVSDPAIILTREGCVVRGKVPYFFNAPVELSGRIISRDPAILFLEQPSVRFSTISLPQSVAEKICNEINPLVNINTDFDFPMDVTLTGVTHDNGKLSFDAILQLPKPKEKK